ncbi:MAG: hypothetical protein ACPL1A_00865 [Candidatus Kapaibacteriota bacterium]
MLNKIYFFAICTLLAGLYSSNSLYADHRRFVWTYEYQIMNAGQAEFESYNTVSASNTDDFENTSSTELNYEFEFGMNKFFDFAIYQTFKQLPNESIRYDGFKLRWRFKIGEKNDYFLDPLIYIEYIGKPNFAKHKIEPKLILAKDIGNFTIALNPYLEAEYDKEWELLPEYSLGISYQINPLMNLGIEAKGSKEGNYIGPTIAHGEDHLWVAMGALFHYGYVEANKPKFSARLLFGIHL